MTDRELFQLHLDARESGVGQHINVNTNLAGIGGHVGITPNVDEVVPTWRWCGECERIHKEV